MAEFTLPADTHTGHIRLQVRNLEAEVHFYRELLGLRAVKQEGSAVFLSATGGLPYLIILSEQRNASPRPRRATGLYHVAIRYPDRRALARALKRLWAGGYPVGGAADHLVSEAIYLSGPEGNGIELYMDRPRDQWPWQNGQVIMATDPLDLEDLMDQIAGDEEPWTGVDPRTEIGHVHLQVSDLARSEQFYHGLLGFDVTQRTYPGALFYSAGGYHHHLGTNVWNSRGAPAPQRDAIGLLSWSLFIRDPNAWDELVRRLQAAGVATEPMAYPAQDFLVSMLVRDPDGIGLELLTARARDGAEATRVAAKAPVS